MEFLYNHIIIIASIFINMFGVEPIKDYLAFKKPLWIENNPFIKKWFFRMLVLIFSIMFMNITYMAEISQPIVSPMYDGMATAIVSCFIYDKGLKNIVKSFWGKFKNDN